MKNKNKQLRLEDITYYSNNRDHPFSFSPSVSPKPKKISIPSTTTNRGMMRDTVLKRLTEYKYGHPSKYHKTIAELRN